MTNANRMYGTEGSSALVPSYPSLMLLEGGAGKKTSGVARRAQGQTPYPQAASRLDVFTVVVCTLLVAMGLFGALVAGNAAIASRKDAALSSIPTQDVVVEPGDSVWDLCFSVSGRWLQYGRACAVDHREELSHHVYPSTRSVVAGSRITLKRFTGLACGSGVCVVLPHRFRFQFGFIESFVVGFWTLCVKFLMESIRGLIFFALSKMRVRGVEGCRL